MLPRHQIELFMTVAFASYLGAFFTARKHWWAHLLLACFGFVADMYATCLMVMVLGEDSFSFSRMPPGIKFHAYMAFVAILAFVIQALLGYQAEEHPDTKKRILYRTWHIKSAKWMFLPVWIVTYASGFALPFLV